MVQYLVELWPIPVIGVLAIDLLSQVPLFVLYRLLSSLWVSRTESASDWRVLQEALFKCIDTIQYNTILLTLK